MRCDIGLADAAGDADTGPSDPPDAYASESYDVYGSDEMVGMADTLYLRAS